MGLWASAAFLFPRRELVWVEHSDASQVGLTANGPTRTGSFGGRRVSSRQEAADQPLKPVFLASHSLKGLILHSALLFPPPLEG